MPRAGRDPLPRDGDTKREREFAGVTNENKSAKEESANWGRRSRESLANKKRAGAEEKGKVGAGQRLYRRGQRLMSTRDREHWM